MGLPGSGAWPGRAPETIAGTSRPRSQTCVACWACRAIRPADQAASRVGICHRSGRRAATRAGRSAAPGRWRPRQRRPRRAHRVRRAVRYWRCHRARRLPARAGGADQRGQARRAAGARRCGVVVAAAGADGRGRRRWRWIDVAPAVPGAGAGLQGLRDWIAAAGGTFSATPRELGFAVRARFPRAAGPA